MIGMEHYVDFLCFRNGITTDTIRFEAKSRFSICFELRTSWLGCWVIEASFPFLLAWIPHGRT